MDSNSKQIYIPLQNVYGRKNNDGTYTLSALDMKAINDNFYYLASKIQGGLTFADMTSEAGQVVSDAEGNISTLQQTSAEISAKVEDNSNNISTLEQTASGLQVSVNSLAARNTVTINSNGLYVTDKNGNSTQLVGDHIKSGTIEGVTLISANSSRHITISGGGIFMGDASSAEPAYMYYDTSGRMYIACDGIVKIESGANMSVDAGGTLHLQTNGGDINIGNGGNIRLNGTVTVNGVPYAPAGGGK